MERRICLIPLEERSLFGFRRKSIVDEKKLKKELEQLCKNQSREDLNKMDPSYLDRMGFSLYRTSMTEQEEIDYVNMHIPKRLLHNRLTLLILGSRYSSNDIFHAVSDSGYAVIKDELSVK